MNLISLIAIIITLSLYSSLFLVMIIRRYRWLHLLRTKMGLFQSTLDYFFIFTAVYSARLLVSTFEIEVITIIFDLAACAVCIYQVIKMFSNIKSVIIEDGV